MIQISNISCMRYSFSRATVTYMSRHRVCRRWQFSSLFSQVSIIYSVVLAPTLVVGGRHFFYYENVA